MVETKFGRNQTYARTVNSKLVISNLRNADCSATILVDELNLSNSAMSSILKDLEMQGLIVASHSLASYKKGRKQVYYTLNKNYGLFVIVCLSNNRYEIILSNLKEEVLYKQGKDIDKYDVEVIYEIILSIKKLLSSDEYVNIPLKRIYISVPGKVNSITGELQLSKQFDKSLFEENNKISDLFNKHFDSPVKIYNDINLAIIGEKRFGALSNVDNAMLIYIDNGVGAAMIFNNEFYGGSNGYAGEIGLIKVNFNGQNNFLDEFISLRSLKEFVLNKTSNKVKSNELIGYYEKNMEIHNHINETAHLLGSTLKDMIEVLNISTIVIQGRISQFKDEYLNCIKQEVSFSQNQCDVMFSKLNGDSIFLGAMSEAVDDLVSEITSKNISKED